MSLLQGDADFLARVITEHERQQDDYNRAMYLEMLPPDIAEKCESLSYQEVLPIYNAWFESRQTRKQDDERA
jgi:hypothetical protein